MTPHATAEEQGPCHYASERRRGADPSPSDR